MPDDELPPGQTTPPRALEYQAPEDTAAAPKPRTIPSAFVNGMLITCVYAALWDFYKDHDISIFASMMFLGFGQAMIVWVIVPFRAGDATANITRRRLRFSLLGGFLNSAAVWITLLGIFAWSGIREHLTPAGSVAIVAGVVLCFSFATAMLLTSGL